VAQRDAIAIIREHWEPQRGEGAGTGLISLSIRPAIA
jgi:hypothetical protein